MTTPSLLWLSRALPDIMQKKHSRASLGAKQCRAGGGEFTPAGAWLTTRQTQLDVFCRLLASFRLGLRTSSVRP
eukprot:1157747-Pelagomonas_calceolata.AAC.1